MERGWITEGLSTFVVNRAGDIAGVMQQYVVTKRARYRRIEWGERYSTGDSSGPDRMEGLVTDELLRYMNLPTLAQNISRVGITGRDFGLDDVEAQAHADCAVVKALPKSGWEGAAMLMSDDPRRAAIIDESLGHMRLDLP